LSTEKYKEIVKENIKKATGGGNVKKATLVSPTKKPAEG
jgi:hypothetical protein